MIQAGTLLHGESLPLPEARPSSSAVGVVGVVLAIATAAWVVVVEGFHRGSVALAAVVLAAVATVVLTRRVAARWPWAVPLAVAVAPALLAAVPGRSVLGDSVVGYSDASGALYLLAAAAATMLALRARGRWRRLGTVVAVGWAAAVVLVRADAAAVFAGLLALVVLVRRRAASRVVLAAGLTAIVAVLAAVFALGVTYEAGGRTGGVDRVVDATMGQTRAQMWHEAVSAIATAPVTGVGVESRGRQPRSRRAGPVRPQRAAPDCGRDRPGGRRARNVAVGMGLRPLVVQLVARQRAARGDRVGRGRRAGEHRLRAALPTGGTGPRGPGRSRSGAVTRSARPHPPPAARLSEPSLTAAAGAAVAVLVLAVPSPLNPRPTVPNGAEWTTSPSGVRFAAPGVVRSVGEPHELYEALTDEPGMSVELWATTADTDQDGPARLVSSSVSTIHRNLTVGQSGDALVVRLRTTETDWNGVDEQIEVPGVFTDTRRRHLVVTHDGRELRVYVDGQLRRRAAGPSGSYAAWNFTYPLLLGNEAVGDRAWLGRLTALAFYDRALSPTQVTRAFDAPPGGHGLPDPLDVRAVARYTFAELDAGVVRDTSSVGLGPALVRPPRLPASPTASPPPFSILRRWRSSEGGDAAASTAGSLVRLVGHAAVFAGLAVLLARAARPHWPIRRTVAGIGSAAAELAIVLSVYRYVQGGAPSAVDVVAATLGAVTGSIAWMLTRRRR